MAYRNVLECAISQIGQGNGPGRSNKYIEWYYGRPLVTYWCAIFISWCFNECGIYSRLDGLSNKAGCEPWRRWAVSKGIWSNKPKVGSIVLYDWNPDNGDGADHIGIVESVFNGGIVAIEGNTSANGSQINGGYVMRKTRYNSKIMGYIHVDTNAVKPEPKPVVGFTRYAGNDRYNTAKATANAAQGRQNGYVLVSGTSYADALSASYFAKQKKCLLLLTSPEAEDDTVKYIKERARRDVFIIGGEGVIPKSIEGRLGTRFSGRLAGPTRYETNRAVLEAVKTPNKQIIVVSGQNFPDGLCAGMIDRPVMLVNNSLKDWQKAYIQERGLDKFYVFGGEGAVSASVFNELNALGEAMRFAGDNRYETSRKIARTFFPLSDTVVIASGKTYPDGLSASNLGDYPLILADHGFTIEARKYISSLNVKKALAVGGEAVLSTDTVNWTLTKLDSVNK